MTDQARKPKVSAEAMHKSFDENYEMLKNHFIELAENGIRGMFLLTDPDNAKGCIMGADKVSLARLICDLMSDDDIYILVHEEMIGRRLIKRGVKYDA